MNDLENTFYFSILIPAFKYRYLREAIQSCVDQTYQNWELIIVDDASPEDLYSIVKEFQDNRIHYYRNDTNYGAVDVVDNWNKCLSYSSGDYVICMGDDDRLLTCCLEEYVKLMHKYPNLGLYHAWTEIIDENGDFMSIQHPRPEFEGCMSLCWNRWNGRNKQFIGDFCFNAKLLKEDGGFYKTPLAWAADDISAVRAARFSGVANTQKLCFQYRENSHTITTTGNALIKIDSLNMERQWLKNFLSSKKELNLDYVETRYYELLKSEFLRHYQLKFRRIINSDIRQNKGHILMWLKASKLTGVNKSTVLYYWLRNLIIQIIN